jgi:hypothetical protein
MPIIRTFSAFKDGYADPSQRCFSWDGERPSASRLQDSAYRQVCRQMILLARDSRR